MTIRSTLALSTACALALSCGQEAPPPPPAPAPEAPVAAPLARLVSPHGQVTLQHGAVRAGVHPDQPLVADDAVETGEDGAVEVRFPDGRSVELGPRARLVLRGDVGALVLEVERGLVLSRVPAGGKASGALTLKTPFGLTRLGAQASELTIRVLEDTAKVDVKLGSVELLSRNGKTLTAGAGQSVDLAQADKPPVRLHPLLFTLVAGSGKVELRAGGKGAWRSVAGRPVALGEGDQLRVRQGSSTLTLEGSPTSVALHPGAELTVGAAQGGDAEQATRLSLARGEVALALAPGKKSSVDLGDARLTTEGGGHFSYRKDRDGVTVEAQAGDAQVTFGDTTQPLAAGEQVRLQKGAAPRVQPLADGELLLVRNRDTVYHPGLAQVLLTWPGGPGDYRVEVSRTPDFQSPILAGLVHRPEAQVDAPAHGVLYWRVQRVGESAFGPVALARFLPEPRRRELERLRNEVPEGSETTTIYFQDKPPAVTFTYKPDPKAAQYKVTVYRQEALDHPVSERLYPTERAPLAAGVLSEGRYVWSVTPLSESGQPLRGGKMSKLEMVYDNSVPQLLVFEPKNGARAERRVHASGVAPVGARVLVNDRPAPLDAQHRFDVEVPPAGRPPRVVFRVTRSGGQDAVTVRVLKTR